MPGPILYSDLGSAVILLSDRSRSLKDFMRSISSGNVVSSFPCFVVLQMKQGRGGTTAHVRVRTRAGAEKGKSSSTHLQ